MKQTNHPTQEAVGRFRKKFNEELRKTDNNVDFTTWEFLEAFLVKELSAAYERGVKEGQIEAFTTACKCNSNLSKREKTRIIKNIKLLSHPERKA